MYLNIISIYISLLYKFAKEFINNYLINKYFILYNFNYILFSNIIKTNIFLI